MGILISINDANFNNYISILKYPNNGNLTCLYEFKNTLEQSIIDKSGNGNDLIIKNDNNNITAHDNYVNVVGDGYSSYFNSGYIPSNNNIACVGIIRLVEDNTNTGYHKPIIGNASASSGFVFGNRVIYKIENKSICDDKLNINASDKFRIIIFRILNSHLQIYLYNKNSDILNNILDITLDGNIVHNSARPLYFCANFYSFNFNKETDFALGAFYDGKLEDADMDDIIVYLKDYCTKNNIDIM